MWHELYVANNWENSLNTYWCGIVNAFYSIYCSSLAITQFEPWQLLNCSFWHYGWPTGSFLASEMHWCWHHRQYIIPASLILYMGCLLKGALWLCSWASKPHFPFSCPCSTFAMQIVSLPCVKGEPLISLAAKTCYMLIWILEKIWKNETTNASLNLSLLITQH